MVKKRVLMINIIKLGVLSRTELRVLKVDMIIA